jgi:hypothetical protein
MASEEGGDGGGDDAVDITVPKRKRKRPGSSSNKGIVLDVAGGKGDLSWLLKNVDGLESIVVDPWKPDPNIKSVSRNERIVRSIEYLRKNPEETKTRSVPGLLTFQPLAGLLPRLLEERTKRLRHNQIQKHHDGDNSEFLSLSLSNDDSRHEEPLNNGNTDGPCCPEDFLTPRILHVPLDEIMVQKVRNRINMDNTKLEAKGGNLTDDNDDDGVHKDRQHAISSDDPTHEDSDGILDLLSSGRIKLIVGFHPDQATEPCIDLAKVLGIPYCVVPCCVFPAEFPNRRLRLAPTLLSSSLRDGNNSDKIGNNNPNEEKEESLVPVRTYQQFLDYLRIKATTPSQATSAIRPDSDDIHRTIHTAYLDFPFTETAKNIVLYTLPPSHPSTVSSSR